VRQGDACQPTGGMAVGRPVAEERQTCRRMKRDNEGWRAMHRRRMPGDTMSDIRRWAGVGLVTAVLALGPWPAHAEVGWPEGRQFSLLASNGESDAAEVDRRLVASLAPGSVLIAQAGQAGPGASPGEWQFRLTPYAWTPRTKMNLTVGPVSRSTTIDFVDIVPQLHFALAGHFEAMWREWTGFLDLLYMSVGKSETQRGVSVSLGLQEGFFEFGGTYRLGPVSLGQAGRLAFEPLAGGRVIWVHESLGGPNQKVSGSADVIDPIIGGRITYLITDTLELWFRGDVGGFGISDNQSNLTYNLIAGVNWRFSDRWSATAGWCYMNIDVHQGRGAGTRNAEVELTGPFLALTVSF
jgi:hypothetical protein